MTVVSPIERPTDATDTELTAAVARLDPQSRALLDLSLRRGLSVEDIADILGARVSSVVAWIDDALFHVSSHAGTLGSARIEEVQARLADLPAEAWDAPRDDADEDLDEPALAAEPRAERSPANLERGGRPLAALAPGLGLLALIAALVVARDAWAAGALLLPLLMIVPGHLLLRALRVPSSAVAAFPVYVPCASITVLTLAGLAVNLIAPRLGVSEPLRALPLLAGVELACLVLLVAGLRATGAGLAWRPAAARLSAAWPLLLPAAAAVGALQLSHGRSNAVALVALVATAVALVVVAARAVRMTRGQLAVVLYGVSLAAIWALSLRGEFPFGWDISSEYRVLAKTVTDGVWHTNHPGDAYGAMLSLTVFPALLHALTGASTLLILKAVYPLLFALFPVALFWIAMRFLSRRWAFVAAAFVVVQPYFFQQLPAIARQEIALLMFVALVAALFDRRLPRPSQIALVMLLGVLVALSHYATTYLAIAMTCIAIFLQLGLRLIRRHVPHVTVPLIAALVALGAGAAVWYGPVTNSSSNAEDFSQTVRERGLDLLPSVKPGENFLQAYLQGNTASRVPAERYGDAVAKRYREARSWVKPLPAASESRYALQDAPVASDEVRAPGVGSALDTMQLVFLQLVNVLAVAGALVLVLRRRTSPLARGLGLLALSTLAALAVIRLSGTAATAYNQERAFVQTMVPLAVAMAWVLDGAARRFRRIAPLIVAAAVAGLGLVFVSGSGLRAELVGGQTSAALHNSGEDYERFHASEPELASARWSERVPRKELLYADRYGQLRLLATSARTAGLLQDPTPRTLDRHAWVYASRTNVVDGRARGQSENYIATYRFPDAFLDAWYDTVYSNGDSKVYHR